LETIDLNDAGQATGTGILNRYPRTQIGIRWDNNVLTAVAYPFNMYNFVNGKAIAADGTVLFAADTYYFKHNGALDAGVLAPPPFTKMKAYDINYSLDVVGSVSKPVGEGYVSSAFVQRDGYQYDLSCIANFPAGWTNLIATSINNSGTIVGYGYYSGGKRYFMLTPGGSTRVGETEDRHQIPTEFRLFQNYPNPFNPTTTISYQIPHATDVQLEIFSLLGQRVRSLANGWQAAGSYEVRVDGTSLASGVYFYRLRAGQYIEKKKMLLLK